MTAMLAKATALALAKHPVVNSSCRDGKSFTYNSSINIAVAVAIDGGLITPVLPDADKVKHKCQSDVVCHSFYFYIVDSRSNKLYYKAVFLMFCQVDIYTLSRKWKELVDKARAKQLQPHEYTTGIHKS